MNSRSDRPKTGIIRQYIGPSSNGAPSAGFRELGWATVRSSKSNDDVGWRRMIIKPVDEVGRRTSIRV